MDTADEYRDSPPETAGTSPRRKRSLRRLAEGRRGHVRRDIALGATCGIAALGIAAAVFPSAFDHSSDARVTLAAGAYRLNGDSGNSGTIAVSVKAYGSLRSVIGGPSVGLTVPHGTTVAELSGRLADQYPRLAPMAMLAVDDGSEMLPLNAVLADGQSVELMPPMSGG